MGRGPRAVFDVDPETGFYRRFFDIDDLAAVRMEREDVFELTHRKMLELVRDGVRRRRARRPPDGLADPAGYLERLRDAGAEHVWVEKILHPGEPLRDWPVDGTVGYEFLNDAQRGVRRPRGEAADDAVRELTGERDFDEVALRGAARAGDAARSQREVEWLQRAGADLAADIAGGAGRAAGLPHLRRAVERARRATSTARRSTRRGCPTSCARVLLLEERGHDEFVTRFQQTSPPVTAKGVEDTAFYRYNRLLALNEVGGDPARFGISVDELPRRRTPARRARAACSSCRRTTPSARPTCARASAR